MKTYPHKIKVEKTTPEEVVYDLQIEDNENFFVKVEDGRYGLVHNCLLKPLEEPSPSTLWILCSMDPAKFKVGKGIAIAKRCTQIVLEPHTSADLLKQARRIAKGEGMSYVLDEENKLLKSVARNCEGDMRTLANIMQAMQQYYDGIKGKKPKMLSKEHIGEVINSTTSSDEEHAVKILTAIYAGSFAEAQKAILNIQDPFQAIQKMMWTNGYVMNDKVLNGARHPKVWGSAAGKMLKDNLVAIKPEVQLGALAITNEALVDLKAAVMATAVDIPLLISARVFRLIKTIQLTYPKK